MQFALHVGVHYTEQERLIKSLLRNKENLLKRGICVPGPNSYRGLVRDTLNAMHRAAPSEGAAEVLLDLFLDGTKADRVVLSDPNFFRTPATAIQKGWIYPAAASRMAHMRALFPHDEIEIFMGIRNPAALVPILYDKSVDKSQEGFWGQQTATDLRWSDTIAQIQEAVPDAPITVWCSEDMPLIWSYIMREIAGLEHHEKMTGGFDLLTSIMSKEGMQRFRSYLDAHPEMTEMQKRRVIAAFLDKFALDDEIEEELDMPGWTEDLVDQLTDIYDEDTFEIERMPGVTFISP